MSSWFKKLLDKIIKFMQTKIQGKVISKPINTSKVNPDPIIYHDDIESGTRGYSSMTFINTGNVPQTVKILSVFNTVNCIYENGDFGNNTSGVPTLEMVIPPGGNTSYNLVFIPENNPAGSAPLTFSFEVEYEWI